MSLSKELQERGFVHQFAAPSLEQVVDGDKRTIYHGIDASADSAHAGNFVIWMLLQHLAKAGHKIIFLVGGGTGMIGDPKPDTERQLSDTKEVVYNAQRIQVQAERLFAGLDVEFVNNAQWLGELKLIDFLRDIGKHYTVNELIKKDAIATRLQSDTGLSYTEFAYPLLQGYDYLQLFTEKKCTVQVGGSDQWGNIISGVELVRRKKQAEVYALTVPLIIDKSTGKKFGKSEGNAVWIDAEKTSPYTFYQFWLNTSDDNVIDYLKLFSFLSLVEIDNIKQEFEVNPGKRNAQKTLAYKITKIVHGVELADSSKKVTGILFGGEDISNLSLDGKKILLENAPTIHVSIGDGVVEMLVLADLASSKREARTFIESGAVAVHELKVDQVDAVIDEGCIKNGLVVLRRGKKKFCVLIVR